MVNTFPEPIALPRVEAGAIVADGTLFMPVDPDGTTTWTLDQDLGAGQWFVRVWGSDIYGDGARAISHFWVDLGEDDGEDGEDPGGCTGRTAAGAAGVDLLGWGAVVVGLLLAGRLCRRRRRDQ
jgi:hypothetical protein